MTTLVDTAITQLHVQEDLPVMGEWHFALASSREMLIKLASTTEDEFLQIGSQLQDFYLRSSEITSMANQLMTLVSGDQIQSLIDRLRQMLGDMEVYLASARSQSNLNCCSMERILGLLGQVSQPLEGFRKMTKTLRMLGISTKIESSRIGEMGLGFLTLAMDVEKLSHLVSEKSVNILNHRHLLAQMLTENLRIVRSSEAAQDIELGGVLSSTAGSLEELVSVNNRCSSFGSLVSSVSGEVSGNISEVVSSMQMHDMTRQQFEHIVEALERLSSKLNVSAGDMHDPEDSRKLVIEAGDVCELQSAQLRFASSELCGAVRSIIDNLRDVASKQTQMASASLSTAGVADSSGGSFMDAMSSGMGAVTAVLVTCAQSDRDMSATLSKVADTMQEVLGFVTDIEEIGTEIDLIALNAQVKAAHTGTEGAALGVLAEAIKRLSVDAITQTELVSQTLVQINQTTENLFQEASQETEQLASLITVMEHDIFGIITALSRMNSELICLMSGLGERVDSLTGEIGQATAAIDVHERVARMSEDVIEILDRIVATAREREPASLEFKDNLRHMEEHYTMQSERHIHEAIARKRSGGATVSPAASSQEDSVANDESEFGDNVDLF